MQPNLGGKMFCAYSLFGSEVKNNKTYMYFWALWEEYRSENRKLVAGTGMDGPITLIATPPGGHEVQVLRDEQSTNWNEGKGY